MFFLLLQHAGVQDCYHCILGQSSQKLESWGYLLHLCCFHSTNVTLTVNYSFAHHFEIITTLLDNFYSTDQKFCGILGVGG